MVNMNVSASNAKMLLRNLKKLKNQADEIQVESCPMFVFFDDESLVELSIILWLCNWKIGLDMSVTLLHLRYFTGKNGRLHLPGYQSLSSDFLGSGIPTKKPAFFVTGILGVDRTC